MCRFGYATYPVWVSTFPLQTKKIIKIFYLKGQNGVISSAQKWWYHFLCLCANTQLPRTYLSTTKEAWMLPCKGDISHFHRDNKKLEIPEVSHPLTRLWTLPVWSPGLLQGIQPGVLRLGPMQSLNLSEKKDENKLYFSGKMIHWLHETLKKD